MPETTPEPAPDATTAPPAPADSPNGDTSASPDDDGAHRGEAGAEAARYRTQLRAAEGQRDALAERVAGYQRADVERLAVGLADPADLWLAGVQLAGLLDDAGAVDPAKVTAAVRELLTTRPHWAKGQPGFNGGVRKQPEPAPPGWGELLRGGKA